MQSHIKSRVDRHPPLLKDWEDQIRQEEELVEKRSRRGRKKRTVQSGPTEAGLEGEQEVDDQIDKDDKDDDEESLIHRPVDHGDESDEEKSDFNFGDSPKESGSE